MAVTIQVRLVGVTLDEVAVEVLTTRCLIRRNTQLRNLRVCTRSGGRVETYFDRLNNSLEVERFSLRRGVGIEQDVYGIVF